ncbi:hypothetical protein DNG35_09690 [Mesonia sp. K7]|nr:hypothetical protein DNG35_09690 [Mesonia sp. K7]
MVALSISCSAEDGQDAMDGATEPQGPAGEDGQHGQDGNANVVASDWFQVQYDEMSGANPPTWGVMSFQNDDIPEVDLEEFVETGGALLVYAKLYEGSDETDYMILSTPTTYGNLTFISGFRNTANGVTLAIQIESADVASLENIPNLTFRYVLVPATTTQAFGLDSDKLPKTFNEAVTLYGLDR